MDRSTTSVASSHSFDSLEEEVLGTLIVVVMKAKNLHNKRAISKQNPFVSVRIGSVAKRTPVLVRGGQTPVWDHESRFKIRSDDDHSALKLCVFDQVGSNVDIIGESVVPLAAALNSPPRKGFDSWHQIRLKGRYVGEVYLEMTFYPKKRSFNSSRSSRVPVGRPLPMPPVDQQDLAREINDGYGASILERLRP